MNLPRFPTMVFTLSARAAILSSAILLLIFTSTSWFATTSKSPIYDEPYHALSSWLQLHYRDYRLDYQDPPLWQYWASLPNNTRAIKPNFDQPAWTNSPGKLASQWYFTITTLYRTPGNNPITFITRCRAMMLPLAILLGILITRWTWQLAGPLAAVIAIFLFCLDPNFLAHSALMKNDVVFALSMFALAFALWKAGKKLTLTSIAWIAALCIATLSIKFTGIIAVLLVPLLLTTRALSPTSWNVFNTTITSRSGRLLIATTLTLLYVSSSYLGIWAVYGFRFSPTPDPHTFLNLTEITNQIRADKLLAQYHGSPPPNAELPTNLPLPATAALFANQHGLFPQAYIAGFLFTYSTALLRQSYLLGQHSIVGWWWYFPFAILVKTPVATLLLTLISNCCLLKWRTKNHATHWSMLCLAIPIALFLASAMSSDLNIGIRHIMPIYPFAFVALGWITSILWQTHGKKTRFTLAALGLLLATESMSAYPNFIPYFNFIAAHSPTDKLALLGDSNLDWGQDLPLLADWQKQNPTEPLYLCYFGLADPAYYKIHYIPLPGGYHYDPKPHFPDPYTHSVLAISATNLQGILLDETLRKYYATWAKRKPRAVLGDSIYLYEYNPGDGNSER